MVREEGTDSPVRDILGFIESFRAIGSSDRKVWSVEYLSPRACARACVRVCVSVAPSALYDTH